METVYDSAGGFEYYSYNSTDTLYGGGGLEHVMRSRRGLLAGGHELGDFPMGLLYVLETCLLAFTGWGFGIILGALKGSPMIGNILAGLVLGPGVLNIVPNFMIQGHSASETGYGYGCVEDETHTCNAMNHQNEDHSFPESFMSLGRLGVNLMLLEAGTHISLAKIQKYGAKSFVAAIFGTFAPLGLGMGLMMILQFPWKESFAAGAALAPTSVGMTAKLLAEFGQHETKVGQIVGIAAMIDDIMSLIVLAIITQIAGDEIKVVNIIVPIVSSIGFIAVALPMALFFPWFFKKYVKKWTRTEENYELVGLLTMLGLAAGLAAATGMVSTELLGCFIAGVCFSDIHEVHHMWKKSVSPIVTWLGLLFFASIGFEVPISSMGSGKAFGYGLLMLIPSIGGKLLAGVVRLRTKDKPIAEALLVGWAMVGRGEFAFLVATTAFDANILLDESFAIIVWALLISSLLFPFAFRFVMTIYYPPEEGTHLEPASGSFGHLGKFFKRRGMSFRGEKTTPLGPVQIVYLDGANGNTPSKAPRVGLKAMSAIDEGRAGDEYADEFDANDTTVNSPASANDDV